MTHRFYYTMVQRHLLYDSIPSVIWCYYYQCVWCFSVNKTLMWFSNFSVSQTPENNKTLSAHRLKIANIVELRCEIFGVFSIMSHYYWWSGVKCHNIKMNIFNICWDIKTNVEIHNKLQPERLLIHEYLNWFLKGNLQYIKIN